MTEELNVDELETPPYTPPYPTDDELDWYVNIFHNILSTFLIYWYTVYSTPCTAQQNCNATRVEPNKSAALYMVKCHTLICFNPGLNVTRNQWCHSPMSHRLCVSPHKSVNFCSGCIKHKILGTWNEKMKFAKNYMNQWN